MGADGVGDQLLDDVCSAVRKFCVLPGVHEYTAVTLWCAYTHFADAFHYAPRLIARSPHKRSGKTRLYEVVAEMVRSPLRSTDATTSYIFRSLDANPRQTLMLDEVDAAFGAPGRAAQNEDLRALLNAGFQRGATVGRTSGPNFTPTNFQTFAPAFLSGIGRLPDTIEDRAIAIPMRRKAPDEHIQPYRPGRDRPELHAIRDRLDAWAETDTPQAYSYANDQHIDLPVDDRAADVWEPLLVVAQLAGGLWPERSRAACVAIVARADEDDADTSPGQQLLEDIHTVFTVEFMPSADLCAALNMLLESGWGDIPLTPHKLGNRLKQYAIKTRHTTDKSRRGYHRADFQDAWRRYLLDEPSPTVPTVPQPAEQETDRDASTDTGNTEPSDQGDRPAATADASDTAGRSVPPGPDPAATHTGDSCPECGTPYGPIRKCGRCIAYRWNAEHAAARKPTT